MAIYRGCDNEICDGYNGGVWQWLSVHVALLVHVGTRERLGLWITSKKVCTLVSKTFQTWLSCASSVSWVLVPSPPCEDRSHLLIVARLQEHYVLRHSFPSSLPTHGSKKKTATAVRSTVSLRVDLTVASKKNVRSERADSPWWGVREDYWISYSSILLSCSCSFEGAPHAKGWWKNKLQLPIPFKCPFTWKKKSGKGGF